MQSIVKVNDMNDVIHYVAAHTVRGECQCGRFFDAKEGPEEKPTDHTIDLVYFRVTKAETADADTFRKLIEKDAPHWLDGEEHGYMEIGGDIGDQGAAMQAMGLGSLLGIWKLRTPKMLSALGLITETQVMQMAGQGLITIQAG